MKWSSIISFFLGLFLAVLVLAVGGLVAAKYLISRLTAPPPRPEWSNEKPSPTVAKKPPTASSPKPTPKASPSPKPSPSPKATPAGSYVGRVTQSIGLILRESPSPEAGQIGGLEFNQRVLVLEDSPDKDWQRVRVLINPPADGEPVTAATQTGQEGWVKRGNMERVN